MPWHVSVPFYEQMLRRRAEEDRLRNEQAQKVDHRPYRRSCSSRRLVPGTAEDQLLDDRAQ